MPGEIPAVNGGNVLGLERVKITRVIPVVEVSAEQFHLAHGRQRSFQPLHRVQRAQPSEVPRADRGKKIEPDVRGRGSVRDNGLGCFLKIVGRERVVLWGNKNLEEAPRAARNQAESLRVRQRQRALAAWDCGTRLIQREMAGAAGPEKKKWGRRGPSLVMPKDQSYERPRWPAQHHRPCAYMWRTIWDLHRNFRLRRRHPFEQVSVRDTQAARGCAESRQTSASSDMPGM